VVISRSRKITSHDLPAPLPRKGGSKDQENELVSAVEEWIASRLRDSSASELEGLFDRFLAECEPTILRQVLQTTNGNRQAAARMLGMHRQTLREKLRKYSDEVDP